MANPDGFQLSLLHRAWRGNAGNVDINRNFASGWGNDERSSSDSLCWNYRGATAMSEDETQCLDRVLKEGCYDLVIDVHSAAGRLIGYIQPTKTEEDAEANKWADYLLERRRLRKAGKPVPPHDPAFEVAMRTEYENKQDSFYAAKRCRETSREESLAASLCSAIELDIEWRRSACGSLQCHSYEAYGVPCFVVETPRCKELHGGEFTKFDHCTGEARILSSRLLQFLKEFNDQARRAEVTGGAVCEEETPAAVPIGGELAAKGGF